MFISEFLKDLTRIEGIQAIAVYRSDNSPLDIWTDSKFNKQILEQVSIHYFQIFSVLESSLRDFQETVITYGKGKIFSKVFPDLLLVIITHANVEMSLIRFIINVKMPELLNSRQFQKILKKTPGKNIQFLNNEYLDEQEVKYLKNIKT
jgi:hypothetical protein